MIYHALSPTWVFFPPWTLNRFCEISPLVSNTSTAVSNTSKYELIPPSNQSVPPLIPHTSMNGSVMPSAWEPYWTPPSHLSYFPCSVTRLCWFCITILLHINLLLTLHCEDLQPESHSLVLRLLNSFLSPCFPVPGWSFQRYMSVLLLPGLRLFTTPHNF